MSQTKTQLVEGLNINTSAPADALAVDNSGRIGVGTSSPSSQLDVRGSATDFDGVRILNTQLSSGIKTSAAIRLGITNSFGSTNGIRNCRIQATEDNTDSNNIHLDFYTNSAVALDSETFKMRLTSGGNLGIGTTSPSGALDVETASDTYFNISTTSGTSGAGIGILSNANEGFIGYQNALRFATVTGKNAAGFNERVRIDSSGNVGIGTASISNISGYAQLGLNNTTGGIIHFYDDGTEVARLVGTATQLTLRASSASGTVRFDTNSSERMRLGTSGSLQVVASNGADTIYASTTASAGTSVAIYRGLRNATTGSPGTGTDVFFVLSNGNVQNTNNSYTAISDIKLKENIVDASSQWDDLKAIQVRNYNFKEETGHETHTQLGVIAQEIELVSPGLVNELPDRDGEGNDLGTITKSVNYSVLYMKAVKALQEAMERIETLETANASLEARLSALEGA